MTTLAVQTQVGSPGLKATSELSYVFSSLVRVGQSYFGCNSAGLFLVDQGNLDLAEPILFNLTLAKTDWDFKNPKSIRFLYVGLQGSCGQVVHFILITDDGIPVTDTYTLTLTGDQRIRVPISMCHEGRYWSITIQADGPLRIDSVEAQLMLRSSGIRGV